MERLSKNLGPQAAIFQAERLSELPRYFCVTDPDLVFNPALPPDFLADLARAMAEHQKGKAGFALDISDRAALKQTKFSIKPPEVHHIWDWEEQFWTNRLGFTPGQDPIYAAAIDTTFALYDQERFDPANFLDALRIGGRFTARHLPWYRAHSLPEDEERAYRETQQHSFYLGTREIAP
ncbi:MAG: hypothetical protein AAFP13_09380 [Pseudomonadota bacterium]